MKFFFRGILFFLLNLIIKAYQRHIECWEGLCQFSCIKIRILNNVNLKYGCLKKMDKPQVWMPPVEPRWSRLHSHIKNAWTSLMALLVDDDDLLHIVKA